MVAICAGVPVQKLEMLPSFHTWYAAIPRWPWNSLYRFITAVTYLVNTPRFRGASVWAAA